MPSYRWMERVGGMEARGLRRGRRDQVVRRRVPFGVIWRPALKGGGLAGGRREGEGGGGVVYADFLELFDGFEDGDAVGGVGEFGGEGGGEAGEAGADDDDVEGGGGCHFGWLLVKG